VCVCVGGGGGGGGRPAPPPPPVKEMAANGYRKYLVHEVCFMTRVVHPASLGLSHGNKIAAAAFEVHVPS
jgi:hypothetical protein